MPQTPGTTPLGIQYPKPDNIIRTGQAGNSKLAQDLEAIAVTTDSAIRSSSWSKGAPPQGANVLELPAGVWEANSASLATSLINRPAEADAPAVITISGNPFYPRTIRWDELPNVVRQPRSWELTTDGADNTSWAPLGIKYLSSGQDVRQLSQGTYLATSYSLASNVINCPTAADGTGYSGAAIVVVHGTNRGLREIWWRVIPNATSGQEPTEFRCWYDGYSWSPWHRQDGRNLPSGFDVRDLPTGVYSVSTFSIAQSAITRPEVIGPAVITVNGAGRIRTVYWENVPNASLVGGIFKMVFDGYDWSDWREATGGVDSSEKMNIAAIASRGTEGEQRGMRRLLQQLHPRSTKPVWAWWAPIGERLTIPTHDGSGEAIHPSLVQVPGGFAGYEYWMACTPYPGWNDEHEDPNILTSHDGITWVVPDGLTNPIDDAPGTPDRHNSDTHLTLVNDRLICSWRTVDRNDSDRNIIYYSTSLDGVIWTPKVQIYRGAVSGGQFQTVVSQSLVYLGDNEWRLYFIRSIPGHNGLTYLPGTGIDGLPPEEWQPAVSCDLGPLDPYRDPWHFEVMKHADQWIMLFSDGDLDTTGAEGDLYMARSNDGQTWDASPLPLMTRVSEGINRQYKPGFIPHGTGDDLSLDVYYSGNSVTTRKWGTFRTTAQAL